VREENSSLRKEELRALKRAERRSRKTAKKGGVKKSATAIRRR